MFFWDTDKIIGFGLVTALSVIISSSVKTAQLNAADLTGRHTCATLPDDAEIPLKIRQMIFGHTSQDITTGTLQFNS